ECRAQGGQNSNNYQKYKSNEAGKDGSDSKAMVVIDGSIDWDKQTEGGNTEPRSLENFGMIAGIKIELDADLEGEVVSADDAIPVGVSIFAGTVAAAIFSPQSNTEFAFIGLSTEVSIPVTCPFCCDSKYKLIEKDYQGQREQLNDCVVDLKAHKNVVKILEKQIKCHQKNQLAYEEKIKVLSYTLEEKSNILEYRQKLIDRAAQEKQELMSKLYNEIANQAKWNNSGRNLYKLIDNSMSVRTKRGLGLDKYIREGELSIDDSKFSIFHTNNDELEGEPIYNRFASVDHMKAVPPPLTRNYMPPSNIPDIDKSQMIYRKKATDSSKIKTNDDSISQSNDSVPFDFSDRFAKNAKRKSILGRRPTRKPVNPNKQNSVSTGLPNPVSAGQQNTVSAGQPNLVSAGQQNSVFASLPNPVFAGQQNKVSAGQPNLVSAGQPNPSSAGDGILGWPWTKYGMSKTKGSKINGGSKSKSWSYAKEKAKDRGIVDSGCSRSRSGNKDKLEDFEDFDDSLLPTIFWTEALATACYVLNRVLVTKPHDKTPYELLSGDKPSISYLKPFGCHVTILNTSDPLGKFDKKSDEGYIIGSTNLTAGSQGATPSNADNLDELTKLQALQRQEEAGKEEADQLRLVFPSLNPILGVGSAPIGSFISAGSTPPVFASSTPQIPTGSVGRPVFAGKPTGSVGRLVSTSRPSGSVARTPVPAGRILRKLTSNTSFERFP
nr:ribonuclease H-like domain-containing protein [Tanacetum cinerariifolium]